MRTSAAGTGLPTPEQAPSLTMPTHDRIGCDEGQVLTPAGAESASQDPQQFVPGMQPNTRSGSSGPSQDGELMAQQQVLEREVVARAKPSQDCYGQQPD